MKKLLLLFLTLLTLNVFGQDTTNTKNEIDLLTSKLTTLHNKIATLDLDISKIKLDLDLKEFTKFSKSPIFFGKIFFADTGFVKPHPEIIFSFI